MSNAPVLVGVAQVLQRTDDLAEVREPLALMIDAARRAAEDAGAPELLSRAGAVRVVRDAAPRAAERGGPAGAAGQRLAAVLRCALLKYETFLL